MNTVLKLISYMKKYNNIAIALIILGVLVNSCGTTLAESSEPLPDEEWNRTYNVPAVDDTQWIEQTSDGGYIIVGSMNYFSHGNALSKEYIVVKTDAKGDQQWNGSFREEDEDRAGYAMQTCIMQTFDSGYLIAGSTENFTTGSLNTWIRKMDAEGIEQWRKDFREARPSRQFFGGNNITDRYNEADRSVRETPDGGFLILGKTNQCQNCSIELERPMDIWLMKIGPEGNEEWNRMLGRTDESAYSFLVTHDGNLVLAGTSYSNITWIKKSDQKGNELWNRTYEAIGGKAIVIRQTNDGGYAAAVTDGSHISLIKMDPNGSRQWEKTYLDSSFLDFQIAQDGSFLLWESAWAYTRLLKVDRDGNEQWRKILNDFIVLYIEQRKEGDYLLAATKLSDDVILGYTIKKLDRGGNELWEKIFGNEFSWSLSVRRKTIAETDDGFVIMGNGHAGRDLKLKKFKNRDSPFAVFTYEPEYPGVDRVITFDASVTKGNITNYRWDFGDGNITDSTAEKITHSYNRTGEATVKLTVMNNSGGMNSTWKKVFIQELIPPEETMNVTFGNFDGAKYVQETHDGGFFIAGGDRSVYEVWIVKTDPEGKEQWNWTYRGMELKSVIQTSDRGFMVAIEGEYQAPEIRLIKIDKNGSEQWNRLFKKKGIGPYLVFGFVLGENGALAQTQDGGYVIAGLNRSDDSEFKTLYEAWLLKTDPAGNETWSRILKERELGQNILSSVQQTTDRGYIVTGTWWNPYGGPDPEVRLMKTDSEGNEKWTWASGRGINGAGTGLQTSDGGFVMIGTSSRLNQSTWEFYPGTEWITDIWLVKTDPNGIEQWKKSSRVKSLAWISYLSETKDGGYIYSVVVQERPENDYEYTNGFSVKFVKLDRDGNIEWQKRDEGYSINQTSDGGYITVKGSRLVKFGGIKHNVPPTGIFQEASEASLNKNLNETRPITPLKKVEGFEAAPAITIFLAAFSTKWRRK